MGASVSFCAPDWEVSVVRSTVPKGQTVPAQSFRSWLKQLGFEQHPGPGNNLTLYPIDIYVHALEGEVAFVTLDFGVVDDSLKRIAGWHHLAQQLCQRWGFSVIDQKKATKVPVEQFLRILSEDKTWQVISNSNGWPSIAEIEKGTA
jgi:hypothetical protein